MKHEVIRKFANISSFDHLVVDSIDGGLLFIDVVMEDAFDILPVYFLRQLMAILYVEDDLLYRDSALDFGILDGWLIDKMHIRKIVFNFVDERCKVDHLVSKSVKS